MSKKTEKHHVIRIIKSTRANGKSLAIGDELSTADGEIGLEDARILMRLGKATPIDSKSKRTATKTATETR